MGIGFGSRGLHSAAGATVLALAVAGPALPVFAPAVPVGGPPNPCYWQTVHWVELSKTERSLLGQLGWNARNWESYDRKDDPPSESKPWADLTDRQRRINEALGISEKSWDNPPECEQT
jgi:hypothetical protein